MHGGQIRSFEILELYKRLGYSTKVVVIKPLNSYLSDKADFEFYVDDSYLNNDLYENANPYLSDLFCKYYIIENLEKIIDVVGNDYDLIHCEMPWLFDLALAIKKVSKNDIKIILGTENVESELKAKILSNAKVKHELVEIISELVQEIEQFAVDMADIVLTVSHYDFNYFSSIAKDSSRIILAKNGIAKDRFAKLDYSILSQVTDNYFIFVGSAHMPNVTGFGEMFSHSLSFLPPDVSVVIVGGVSTLLEQDPRFSKYKHLNDTRIIRLNNLEEAKLNALLLNANAILLPVIDGGGSNLKTAEALLSNRVIIATRKSFVGYESYINQAGIYIANEPRSFADAMLSMINEKKKFERKSLINLTWSITLKDFAERVGGFYE